MNNERTTEQTPARNPIVSIVIATCFSALRSAWYVLYAPHFSCPLGTRKGVRTREKEIPDSVFRHRDVFPHYVALGTFLYASHFTCPRARIMELRARKMGIPDSVI